MLICKNFPLVRWCVTTVLNHTSASAAVADAYARMSQVMADNAVAADAQEGIDAFLSKREPQWQHRR